MSASGLDALGLRIRWLTPPAGIVSGSALETGADVAPVSPSRNVIAAKPPQVVISGLQANQLFARQTKTTDWNRPC